MQWGKIGGVVYMAKKKKDKYVCLYCSNEYVDTNFYNTNSEFYSGVGKLPYCKQCIEKFYQYYFDKYTNEGCLYPEKKAVKRLCMAFDIYYREDLFNSSLNKVKESEINISPMGQYMKVIQLYQYNRNKETYENTITKEEEKELIAKKAADLIEDNCTVIFDSSSTVRRICKHIKERKNLTVITNNLRVCEELKNSNIKVFCTGGSLIQKRECFVGHFAEEFVKKTKADVLFFSSQGLSQNGDITDSSEEEIALRKIMIENSKRQYFLCDSSKIGVDFPFTLCNKNEITDIILKT